MKLPHENYIRFLITTGLDSQGTEKHLEDLGLVFTGNQEKWLEYWNQQYEIMEKSPVPRAIKKFWFDSSRPFPQGFLEYMNVLNLKEAWLYNMGRDKYFKFAIDVLSDPSICIAVKALLAIRTEFEEISALMNGKYATIFPKESVDIFQKYFFNTKGYLRSEWRTYLDSLENEEKRLLYLAISGQSVELRAELGLPNRLSVSEQYQKIHIFAMQKFDNHRRAEDPKSDAQAMKWASVAMQAGDKYEKLKTSDASDFSRDLQLEFEQIDTDFPLISGNDVDQLTEAKKEGTKRDKASPIPMQTELEVDDKEPSGG